MLGAYTLHMYKTKTAIIRARRTNKAPKTITNKNPPLARAHVASTAPVLWGKCTVTGTEVCLGGLPESVATAVKCIGDSGGDSDPGCRSLISPKELIEKRDALGPETYFLI